MDVISLIMAVMYFSLDSTCIGYPPIAKEEIRHPIGFSIGAEYDSKRLFFRTQIDTLTRFRGANDYRPFYATYIIDGGIKYKWLTLGYYHECRHSILSSGYDIEYPVFGGKEYVYLKAKIKVAEVK